VPSHCSVVAHSVPIAAAETDPVAVRQRPPRSLTHRRRARLRRGGRLEPAAAARGAQPVSDGRRSTVVGTARLPTWRTPKAPSRTIARCWSAPVPVAVTTSRRPVAASTSEVRGTRSSSRSGRNASIPAGRTAIAPDCGATPTDRPETAGGIAPNVVTRRTRPLAASATRKPPPGAGVTPAGEASRPSLARPPSPASPRVVPATVKIVPSGVMRRTRSFEASLRRIPPLVSAATLTGAFSRAARAGSPSPANPSPAPATVVTPPSGPMRRTRSLPVSATMTAPSTATATSRGPLSPPATVVTVPFAATRWIRLLPVSATRYPPSGATAVSDGRLSPVRTVVTAPPGETRRIRLFAVSATR
jgi:hypothetical protein